MLTADQIDKLKKKLEKDKGNMEKQLSKFAKEDKKVKGNYKAEFPKIGSQIDENAQEIQEYEQNVSLEHNFETELKAINKALGKIEKGKFGICESCGKNINFERLKIRPQAAMCIECKSKKETGGN